MSNLYMCILRNRQGGCEGPSPSQMEEAMAKFQKWQEKYSNNIADMGGRLGDGKVLSASGAVDGPFMADKEPVGSDEAVGNDETVGSYIAGGYMVVRAESMDEAVIVVRECPPVAASLDSTSVEIREILTN